MMSSSTPSHHTAPMVEMIFSPKQTEMTDSKAKKRSREDDLVSSQPLLSQLQRPMTAPPAVATTHHHAHHHYPLISNTSPCNSRSAEHFGIQNQRSDMISSWTMYVREEFRPIAERIDQQVDWTWIHSISITIPIFRLTLLRYQLFLLCKIVFRDIKEPSTTHRNLSTVTEQSNHRYGTVDTSVDGNVVGTVGIKSKFPLLYPTKEIDAVWREHLLRPSLYLDMCHCLLSYTTGPLDCDTTTTTISTSMETTTTTTTKHVKSVMKVIDYQPEWLESSTLDNQLERRKGIQRTKEYMQFLAKPLMDSLLSNFGEEENLGSIETRKQTATIVANIDRVDSKGSPLNITKTDSSSTGNIFDEDDDTRFNVANNRTLVTSQYAVQIEASNHTSREESSKMDKISSTQQPQQLLYSQAMTTCYDAELVYDKINFFRCGHHTTQCLLKEFSLLRVMKNITFQALQDRLCTKLFSSNSSSKPQGLILRWKPTDNVQDEDAIILQDNHQDQEKLDTMLRCAHTTGIPIQMYCVRDADKMVVHVEFNQLNEKANRRVFMVNIYESTKAFKQTIAQYIQQQGVVSSLESLRLIFRGQEMHNSSLLTDYQVNHQSIVHARF